MPQFAFIAKDRLGNTIQGNVQAQDAAFAANEVGRMGYALVELQPAPVTSSEPTTAFTPPAGPPSAAAGNITQPIPTAPAPLRPSAPPASSTPAATDADVLRADAETRRKVELDLARLGMKPDEIIRFVNANANTTAPPPSGAASVVPIAPAIISPSGAAATKRRAVQNRLADRTADLQSFAAQLQSTAAATRIEAVEAVNLDLPAFRDSSPQERVQAETLLREVYALRRREKYPEALTKCREALALVPSDAAAIEMFGDLLQGLARTSEALAAYKRAVEADPKRASAERKYGDLLMRQQHWVERDTEEVPKNPIAAAAFSLLIPGAGQIHNGERVKGLAMLLAATVCAAALLFFMRDKMAWETSWQKLPGAPPPKLSKHVAVDWGAQAPAIACVLIYSALSVGSAIDAAKVAHRDRTQ